jgi:signal transduction histidine kinase
VQGIRLRITAVATVVVAVVLLAIAVALVLTQQRVLTESLDGTLELAVEDLARTQAEGRLVPVLAPMVDDDAVAQVVSPDGAVLAATANFAGQPPLPDPPGDSEFRTVRLLAGEPPSRLLSQRSGDVVIHAAAPADDIAESLAALRLSLMIALPLAVAALAGLTWWLVGRTLRPVEAIRRQVADITAHSLHRRVPEPATADEIQRLARTMNDMLNRLQAAVERQQRFVADASHELRSPLTRIRTELEVDALHPETADLATTHASVLAETCQLQALVEDLLLLARHDTGPPSPGPRTVELGDVVREEARLVRRTAPVEVVVDVSAVAPCRVTGDAGQLGRVVRNLLDNAARHAAAKVTVALDSSGDRVRLTVSDDGPGIDPADREFVFRRFSRLDAARQRPDRPGAGGMGGTGLGLAIAHDIVMAHGGTIAVADHTGGGPDGTSGGRPPAGARIVVELPAPNGAGSDPA